MTELLAEGFEKDRTPRRCQYLCGYFALVSAPRTEAPPAGRMTAAQGAALYVGAVLGTGVIALPGLAARVAGPASLLAWVALVLLSIPLAATFGVLGSR